MCEQKYTVVVIDDDEVSINMLQSEIEKYSNLVLVGVARTGASGFRLVEKIRPDVLFLDIELPDIIGVDLLVKMKSLCMDNLRVVFYTAFNKYMIEALRNTAFDFLLKPIDSLEFKNITVRLFKSDSFLKLSDVDDEMVEHTEKKFMIMTPTGDICFPRASEIGYFRYISDRKIWEVLLSNGKVLPLKRNITAEQLRHFDANFVQVHQSFIINLNYLMMVQDGRCMLYPPFEKEMGIVLSKKYRKEMMDRFYLL